MNRTHVKTRLSDILNRLDSPQKSGSSHWTAKCPAHDDSSPSLSFTLVADEDGSTRVLMNCFAGCGFRDICEALELHPSDLFDIEIDHDNVKPGKPGGTRSPDNLTPNDLQGLQDRLSAAQSHQAPVTPAELDHRVSLTPEVVSAWGMAHEGHRVLIPARDVHGTVKGLRLRDFGPNPEVKELGLPNPVDPDAGWLPYTYVPFPDGSVHPELVVTEGPIDGLTMSVPGYDVFAVFGVKAVNPVLWRDLLEVAQGRTVIVCADADDAGRKFASEVSKQLRSNGVAVRVVEPPREKWDMNDWYRDDREGFPHVFRYVASQQQAEGVGLPVFDGNADRLIDQISQFLRRFLFIKDEGWFDVLALWVANTFLIRVSESIEVAPRIGLVSSQPASGKTLAQDLLMLLSSGEMISDTTAAAVLRSMSGMHLGADDTPVSLPIPLAIDEIDNIYKSRNSETGSLTSILNQGYKRGAKITKADVNDQRKAIAYDCFGPIVWGGLAKAAIPEALSTRSLVIEMEKALPHERPERYRTRKHGKEGANLAAQLHAWALANADDDILTDLLDDAEDELVSVLSNRDLELWSALMVPAMLAGGEWPERLKAALMALKDSGKDQTETMGLKFLKNTRDIFDLFKEDDFPQFSVADEAIREGTLTDKVISRDTLAQLVTEVDPLFKTLNHGHGLHGEHVRSFLREFKLTPKQIKSKGKKFQGYRWEDLTELWDRYLSPDDTNTGDNGTSRVMAA